MTLLVLTLFQLKDLSHLLGKSDTVKEVDIRKRKLVLRYYKERATAIRRRSTLAERV